MGRVVVCALLALREGGPLAVVEMNRTEGTRVRVNT